MARFYGTVGFAEILETNRGVFSEVMSARPYFGDVIRNSRRLEPTEHLNDNVVVSNTISIVADAYAFMNFSTIRYVEWMGTRWKVTSIDVQHPRLLLTLGGVYNV